MFPGTITVADTSGPVPRLAVDVHTDGDASRIDLAGEVTRGTFPALTDAVRERLADGCSTLQIGMQAVTFLDARGLTALIVVARMAAESGARLTIESPSPLAARMLEIGGLEHFCRR